ncbi:MAG: AGE family epimerase/isomerase [Chitinophagales bacterium]|nr:AGE family epimerase/isomerase [Chitinophagales bacterium]
MSNHELTGVVKPPGLHHRLSSLLRQSLLEKESLINWWSQHIRDGQLGFYGEIDQWNKPVPNAPVGLVLCSRILWTFAAAWETDKRPLVREIADRAYHYLIRNFEDAEYGGMYWSLTATGQPLQEKKQIYGQAFAIYGLSEYARVTGLPEPLMKADTLFRILELRCRDMQFGGYPEAFTRNWEPVEDMRLSDKDANEKKSMNTHLHLLEAYANLYRIMPSESLAEALHSLLSLFKDHIIDRDTFSMHLFFSEQWEPRSSVISYGHDIEASWLLCEAAVCLGYKEWIDYYNTLAPLMTDRAMAGMDTDGGLMDETDAQTGVCKKEKHWWQQAETMVGLLNAYQLSGKEGYLDLAEKNWIFINKHIRDHQHGEWFWGVDIAGQVMNKEKAGFWKCPYHNVRACIEISSRCSFLLKENEINLNHNPGEPFNR